MDRFFAENKEKIVANVEIHDEVRDEKVGRPGWVLCFQRCTWHFDDEEPSESGYRYIWRRPDGKLQAARGQARIPDGVTLFRLAEAAKVAGWFK